MNDRFGKAIGIWHIDVAGADLDIEPKVKDFRRFRDILVDDKVRKDKTKLFALFEQFMVDLIRKSYPDDPKERVEEYVVANTLQLFEEAMVAFRLTTRKDLEEQKARGESEIKKLIGGD